MRKILLIVLCLVGSIQSLSAQDTGEGVNLAKRREIAKEFVNDAAAFFVRGDTTIPRACHDFQRNKRWQKGDLSVFVFDAYGVCLVHGDERSIIWKNFSSNRTVEGNSLIKSMLKRGKKGGWVTYEWNNGLKTAHVRTVIKNGKPFIIGTGFYPQAAHAIAQLIVSLIQGSINSIGLEKTASIVNDPYGPFVRGYITASIIDFDGNVISSAEYPVSAGQNFINYKDTNGTFVFKEMIKIGKTAEGTGWLEYNDKNEFKRSYIKRTTDQKTGKKYIITAGYYPDIDDRAVKSFVRRGINYLRANGRDAAYHEFSNMVGDFVRGGLRIYMYDLQGNVIADGYNPFLVGQNIINIKDREGRPRVKKIMEQIKRAGRGWTSYKDKNGYFFTYFEKVEVPDGTFIIGSGFYPWSKAQEVRAMVEDGLAYLQGRELIEALNAFVSSDTDFLRGDIHLIVYDNEGYNLAYSLAWDRIWDDIKDLKDDRGRSVFEKIRSTAARGGGWIEYEFNNALRRKYVKQIEKKVGDTTQTIIVSSGYYVL